MKEQKMKTADEIIEDMDYLFSKVNWAKSFLDAKAIAIMGNLSTDIKLLERNQVENKDETH